MLRSDVYRSASQISIQNATNSGNSRPCPESDESSYVRAKDDRTWCRSEVFHIATTLGKKGLQVGPRLATITVVVPRVASHPDVFVFYHSESVITPGSPIVGEEAEGVLAVPLRNQVRFRDLTAKPLMMWGRR